MTLEEFVEYYHKYGVCPNDISPRTNILNEKQIKTRYTRYMKSLETKAVVVDEQWEWVKEQIDTSKCNFITLLKSLGFHEEVEELKQNGKHLIYIIDIAHVFPRSGYPYLKYNLDNLVPLNRFSHSCLDTMRDPITGEAISKEERDLYWKNIIGFEKYSKLEGEIYNYVNRNSFKKASEKI